MAKAVKLDEIFYGSGAGGYGILDASIADRAFCEKAVAACLAAGRMGAGGLPKPILVSRILGENVVMARLAAGALDAAGRRTLFIHAIVARRDELVAANVSAWTLLDAGMFRDSPGPAATRSIDAQEPMRGQAAEVDIPAAIVSKEPQEGLFRSILRGRENSLSWATFAFGDVPGCDVIGLSHLAPLPPGRTIYDEALRVVRRPAQTRPAPAAPPPRAAEPAAPPPAPRKSPALAFALAVSLALNVALVAAMCYANPSSPAVRAQAPKPLPPVSLEEARNLWGLHKSGYEETIKKLLVYSGFVIENGQIKEK